MLGEGTTGARQAGGIVGRIQKGDTTMEHCLNTGTISCEASQTALCIGGICGYFLNGSEDMVLNISDCLNAGSVDLIYNVGVGTIIGRVKEETTVNIQETYSVEGCYTINMADTVKKPATVGYNKGTVNGLAIYKPKEMISGYEAYRWTNLDFSQYWAVVLNDTPILKTFATKSPSVAGIKKMFDTSWYDANKNTFVLKDKEDLYGFSHLVAAGITFKDKTVSLENDIAINEGNATDWSNGINLPSLKWIPIGNVMAFEGTFDGQGHTISGLYGTAKSNHMGLFGWTGESSTVKNLRVTNSYFEMNDNQIRIGSIAGRGEGVFDTIYSDAIITCTGQANGGIVGYKASEGSSSIVNCWYAGTINMLGDNSKYTGGIVGRMQNGKLTIDNCLFTGTIQIGGEKRSASVGGLCGYAKHNVVIKNSLSTGGFELPEASGMNSARRIIGQIANEKESNVTVENVYYTIEGKISTASWYCAGDLATIKGGAEAKPREDIVGYNGHRTTALDFDKYWAVVLAETSGADGTPVLKNFASAAPSVAGIEKIFDVSWYKEKKNSYVLYDKEDLYGFAYLCNSGVNFKDKTIKLGKNITVNTNGTADDWAQGTNVPDYRWTPAGKIAAFEGTFDGNGKTISGLYGTTDSVHMGLFGSTGKDSTVKNLSIKNSYFESAVTSGARIGSVAGRGEGSFHTIYSDAIITTYGQANGGIVGYKSIDGETAFINCCYSGTIHMKENSSKFTGGILGRTEKGKIKIDNCLFSGTISVGGSTRSSSTGAFVGIVNDVVSVSNSLNSGNFEFKEATKMNSVGRIFGQITNASDSKVKLENVYYTTVGKNATTKWYCSGNKPTIKGTPNAMAEKDILGYLAYFHTALNFDEYWSYVIGNEAGTPVLKSFAKTKPSLPTLAKNADISWYDKTKDTYTLDSTEDFRGFGYLSSVGMNFEGKTIKLTADVELNTGNVNERWDTWTPIGTPTCEFAGEFNGNSHSISGVYVNASKPGAGLFGGTAEGSAIKNLKLENSYITSTARYVGSVVGSLSGDMENVYSSATVVTDSAYAGGLVGQIWSKENVNMTCCWYNGNASFKMSTGGLVGKIAQGTVTMTDCLNSGTITCTSTLNGGICGVVLPSSEEWEAGTESGTTTVVMTNVLNIGTLSNIDNTTTGSVFGKIGTKTKVTFDNVYTTYESYVHPSTNTSKAIGQQVASANVTGADDIKMWSLENELTVSDIVTEKMVQDKLESLNFNTVWAIGSTGTPILQWAANPYYNTAWYNETDTIYNIYTAKDLYGLSYLASQGVNFAGKTIRLQSDVTLNDGTVDTWNTQTGAGLIKWTPIGSPNNEFAGIFDGNEHSIRGLYVNADEIGAGLFGGTAENSVIKNVKLENSYITSTARYVGSIVGSLSGNMENVYSSATVVTNAAYAGGLVGQIWSESSVSMTRCCFAGSTSVKLSAGGLVGKIAQGNVTMTDCLNSGTITCTSTLNGGICGIILPSSLEWEAGTETGTTTVIMTNVLNIGTLSHVNNTSTGSIFGKIGKGTEVTFSNVHTTYESYVNPSSNTSKAIGQQVASADVTGGADIKMWSLEDELTVSGSVTENVVQQKLTGFDFNNTWGIGASKRPELQWVNALYADTSWYDEAKDSFTLTTAEQLYGLAYLCKKGTDFSGKTMNLGTNIIVNDGTVETWKTNSFANLKEWIPIGTPNNEFAGTFDGKGYSISGIYVNAKDVGAGLFGSTSESSVIKNLKLANSYITSTARYVGSVAGSLSGNMENVYSSATVVTNSAYAGGLVGQIWSEESVQITRCWYSGNASFKMSTGGLVGKIAQGNVTMTDCLNSGTITCSSTLNGGICGTILPSDSKWGAGNETGETKVTMSNVLNIGTLTHINNTTTGSVFGKIGTGTEVTFVNVYTTYESYINPTSDTSKAIGTKVASSTVTGEVNMKHDYELTVSDNVTEAAVKEKLTGFDFTNVWTIGTKGTLELK